MQLAMKDPNLLLLLLVSGVLLLCIEVFVPGGVLGIAGTVLIIWAVVEGYRTLGPEQGTYLMIGVMVFFGIALYLWVRFFPRSPFGRWMSLGATAKGYRAAEDDLEELMGREGVARSPLRPSGVAEIDGRRVDVVTEGGMISRGAQVKVIEIEGNRVVVREMSDSAK
jgi:membrane-bound ClpP family serine protease